MDQKITFKKLPGILAFKRGHVISDALMFNQLKHTESPVQVIRHGILGTQNTSDSKDREVSNPKTTEICKTRCQYLSDVVCFGLSFLPLEDALNACVVKNKQESSDIRRNIYDSRSVLKRLRGYRKWRDAMLAI